jgi:hypothetical protein
VKQSARVDLYYDGSWHDHTSAVYTRDPITIDRGVETTATLTFDNRSGLYSPRSVASALFGKIGQNTPLRIRCGADVRFVGEVSTWTPGRAIKGDAWVSVTAAGVKRRLGRGVDPLKSAARQYYENSGALGYWAMEPATRMSNTVDATRPLQYTGTNIDFNIYDGPFGSDKGPKFFLNDDRPPVSQIFAPLAGTSTSWIVNLWFRAHPGPDSAVFFTPVVDFAEIATTGTIAYWTVEALSYPAGSQFEVTVTGYDANRNIISPTVSAVVNKEIIDDKWHMVTIQGEQSGGFGTVALTIDAGSGASGFSSTYSNGALLGVYLPKRVDASNVADPSIMHLAAWDNTSPDYTDMYFATQGWPGETAAERFLRLMAEQDVDAIVVGDPDDAALMGPQVRKTLLEYLDEIERTDDATIFETRDALGLTMRTGVSKLNQTSDLTLSYTGGQIAPPLTPVVGDSHIRNDVTASNFSGGEARVEQTAGPLNTQLPGTATGAVGRYQTRVDVSLGDFRGPNDAALPHVAGWRVNKGTFDGTWYAEVTADLDAAPGIAPTVTAVDIGDLITLVGLPTDEALDSVEHLVTGYTEIIGSHRRTIKFELEPAQPYQVGKLALTTGDTDPIVGHLDPDGSTTNGTTAVGAATFSVATPSGPLWTTTADDFPFDVVVGGQRVSISAISGASSPQTFTVQSTGRKVRYAIASGSAVTVHQPIILTQ